MTPEIKQRIEQIRRGEVPDGYKKTKAGVIPEDWEVKKLKTICDVNPVRSNNIVDKVVFLGMSDVSEDGKILNQEIVDYESVKKGFTPFQKGDILVAKITPCFENGKGAYAEALMTDIGFGSTEFHVLRCKNNAKFIFFHTTYPIFRKKMESEMTGSAGQKRVQTESIANYIIPFPPLPEQQKIAAILTTQDRVIELKQQLLAQKQQQKKYLMQQFLTGKKRLPGFNGEWRKEQVRNLCTVVKGEQLNKDILDEIGLYYVLNGGMTPSGYTNKWNIMENTISISEGGNSCGYVNFNREKFWSGGHCYTLQFVKTSEIMNLFLYFYLKFCENKLQCLRVGSGLPNIQKSSLENFNVTYPSLEEQTAIADVLSAADREIDLLRQNIEAEKQKKKALMQLLLTGIVRVTGD